MTVYQVTFRSGAQQFFDMDIEEALKMSDILVARAAGEPTSFWWTSSTGANLDLRDVVGFQHYIPLEVARSSAMEDEGVIHDEDADRALDAAIQAMMKAAEVEEGVVVTVETEPVRRAFFDALRCTDHPS